MRRALLSLVVGLAGAAVVTGAGWSVQTLSLPPPERANRIAADAAEWFHRYALAVDVFHTGGRTIGGLCLRGPSRLADGRHTHDSLLGLGLLHGPTFSVARHAGGVSIRGTTTPTAHDKLAATIGCTYPLFRTLSRAATGTSQLRAERAFTARQPAIALRLAPRRGLSVTVYVSPRTYRPLAATVSGSGREVTARLFLVPASPALAARLGVVSHGGRGGAR